MTTSEVEFVERHATAKISNAPVVYCSYESQKLPKFLRTIRERTPKMDTILDTKGLIHDYEKSWRNGLEFYMTAPHSFPRKCSAIYVRKLFLWCSYRMEGQIGKIDRVRQLAPFLKARAAIA